MNREDIIRMAREAELNCHMRLAEHGLVVEDLEHFAALVAAHTLANIDPSKFMSYREGFEVGAAAEREACAKVADAGLIGHTIAKAIRARSKE